jgi:hypothetical protein
MKTVHNTLEAIEEAKTHGFTHGIKWESKELGAMIDLYKYPVKGSKKI